mmetsp:Transcript_96213/g.170831  ORF Transcript_96213/g.170831 Transcript_96213/m.170831 type:complete len:258 (+) Transcript_96213:347-1120(+)
MSLAPPDAGASSRRRSRSLSRLSAVCDKFACEACGWLAGAGFGALDDEEPTWSSCSSIASSSASETFGWLAACCGAALEDEDSAAPSCSSKASSSCSKSMASLAASAAPGAWESNAASSSRCKSSSSISASRAAASSAAALRSEGASISTSFMSPFLAFLPSGASGSSSARLTPLGAIRPSSTRRFFTCAEVLWLSSGSSEARRSAKSGWSAYMEYFSCKTLSSSGVQGNCPFKMARCFSRMALMVSPASILSRTRL